MTSQTHSYELPKEDSLAALLAPNLEYLDRQIPRYSTRFPDSTPLLGMLYNLLEAQRALYDARILPRFLLAK